MKDLKLKLVFALITAVAIAVFTWGTIEKKKAEEAYATVVETIKEKDGYIETGWSIVQFANLGGGEGIIEGMDLELLPYNKQNNKYYISFGLAIGTATFEVDKDSRTVEQLSNFDALELSKSLDSMYATEELIAESINKSIKEMNE